MKKTDSAKALLTALEIELGLCPEIVPKEYRTVEQWADAWGCHKTNAWKLIMEHVDSGRMEKKKFRITTKMQNNRPVCHYRAAK